MGFELLASVLMIVSMMTFTGIVWWALSRRRQEAFDAAAQLPFALCDEFERPPAAATERKS
jgi:cytochrome c oxidase cbb3-type subunit IV